LSCVCRRTDKDVFVRGLRAVSTERKGLGSGDAGDVRTRRVDTQSEDDHRRALRSRVSSATISRTVQKLDKELKRLPSESWKSRIRISFWMPATRKCARTAQYAARRYCSQLESTGKDVAASWRSNWPATTPGNEPSVAVGLCSLWMVGCTPIPEL
jgi:hypothetical protein